MKLMMYESSKKDAGEMTSFQEYIDRMPEDQTKIYFLIARNRKMAEASPYMEGMSAGDTEVLFMYDGLDDAVMNNAREFQGKQLVTIESSQVRPPSTAPPRRPQVPHAVVSAYSLDADAGSTRPTARLPGC